MEAVVKIKRVFAVLTACVIIGLTASASAQHKPGGLAKEEAEQLAEQRRQAAEERNRDDVILHQALGIIKDPEAVVGDDPNLTDDAARQASDRFTDDVQQIVEATKSRTQAELDRLLAGNDLVQRNLRGAAQQSAEDADGPPVRYQLYVSQSMGRAAMQQALAQAELNQDMVLVFRGLKRGQKFVDIMRLVTDLHVFKEGDSIPRIIIDPTQFTENNVTVVPTLTKLDENGKVVAIARGVSNPRWIDDQVANGRHGDLGRGGATQEIDEVDMITLLQEAAQKIDFEAYGRKQVETFWTNRQYTALPTATESRVREVDPTVVMTETITAPDGTVLAYPGQRLNPFDALPFTMKLLIFSGREDAQVAWARRMVLENEGKEVRVIATEFRVEGGWEEYHRLIGDVGRMVYFLENHVKDRFQIEKVPTLIEGGDRVLVLREFARSEIIQGGGHAGSVSARR